MNLSSISKQLVHDMKAIAGKTVVLALLLLVGLFFWVPPLLKAFSGRATVAPSPSVDASATASGSTATASSTALNSPESAKKSRDSKTLLKLLHEQPLLQSASAEEMPSKPFGLNDELLPLPLLIADDALAETSGSAAKLSVKPIEQLDGLDLKSTLIGPNRRVAMINNQLFHEGQSITWNDRQLLLETVNRKSVTLTDGSKSWQLTLTDSRDESRD